MIAGGFSRPVPYRLFRTPELCLVEAVPRLDWEGLVSFHSLRRLTVRFQRRIHY